MLINLFVSAAETEKRKEGVYVGIDLGTTFSCACLFHTDSKSYEYLIFGNNVDQTVPSTVYVDENNNSHVGYAAEAMNHENPSSTNYFYGFKRLMGLTADHKNVKSFRDNVTYRCDKRVVKSGEDPVIVFPAKLAGNKLADYSPTNLSMLILNMIRSKIEQDYKILHTVITTPAYFTVTQDTETREAALAANFKTVDIFKEPTAACIEYAQTNFTKFNKEEKSLVFDLGGGTFDISIVEVENEDETVKKEDRKVFSNITVTKYVGDNFLGGENINSHITEHFKRELVGKDGELSRNEELRLRLFVEKLKIKACEMHKEDPKSVASDDFFYGDNSKKTFSLDKKTFDRLAKPVYDRIHHLFFDRNEGLFRTTNSDSHDKPVTIDEIEKVILVGGSTRVPYIREYLTSVFSKAVISTEVDADKSVAKGACIMCVNQDADSGEQNLMLLNTTTLPIGIAVHDGSFKAIVMKDVVIPTEAKEIFSTVSDYQDTISVRVASGVRALFKDNDSVGSFEFKLKNPRPRGVPKIEIKCHMNSNYELTVTATDLDYPENTSMEVFKGNYVGIDRKKAQEILEKAKLHEEEDKQILRKLEMLREYKGTIELFEKRLNAVDLGDEKIIHQTVLDTHKDWDKANSETASSDEIESQVENLKNDLKNLEESISKTVHKKGEDYEKREDL